MTSKSRALASGLRRLPGAALLLGAACCLVVSTGAAHARSWGYPRSGPMSSGSMMGDPLMGPGRDRMTRSDDPREGRVEVSRFVTAGPEAAELGKGTITVQSASGDGPFVAPSVRAPFEAAVVDALVGQGYDTLHADAAQGQTAALRISRRVLVPAESRRSPVSGAAAMEVGTRGSAYGLAVNVDLTKPRTALVETRMDLRIVDPASKQPLWEGYATIATREGDSDWSDGLIATKLARALFDNFPEAQTVGMGPSAPPGSTGDASQG